MDTHQYSVSDAESKALLSSMLEPFGPIAICSCHAEESLLQSINYNLARRRQKFVEEQPQWQEYAGYLRNNYLVEANMNRFGSGEGYVQLKNSVRGHDFYIICDVLNHGNSYDFYNESQALAPDEIYQDLQRIILSVRKAARRINIIMPYLYEGRRFRRTLRDSLDCGEMLQHLFSFGIDNFITFDAHDSRVANAVPYSNFESFPTSYQFVKTLISDIPDLKIDASHMMVVAPNEVNIDRSIFYASTLQLPLGIFYQKHGTEVAGKEISRYVTSAFLGDSVKDKDVLMICDLIDTSEKLTNCASVLKANGANHVYVFASYVQFTKGLQDMRQAYESKIIDKVFATDMSYRSKELLISPWYKDVPMSSDIALLISALNHDASLSKLLAPATRIKKLLLETNEVKKAAFSQDKTQLSFKDMMEKQKA